MSAIVHLVFLADDVGVASFLLLPKFVTQDEHRRRSGPFVIRLESAPQNRLYTQKLEETGGYHAGADAVRFGSAEQRERHGVVLYNAAQAAIPLPVIVDLRHRKRQVGDTALGSVLAQNHQLVALSVRQRAQEHRVDHGKDGCVGADAESQNQHRGERVPAILAHHAQGESRILRQYGDVLARRHADDVGDRRPPHADHGHAVLPAGRRHTLLAERGFHIVAEFTPEIERQNAQQAAIKAVGERLGRNRHISLPPTPA